MTWNSINRPLNESIEDYSQEIIFRTTARSLTQISRTLELTRLSKERATPFLLNLFRGLFVARVFIDTRDDRLVPEALSSLSGISPYQQLELTLARLVRYSITASLPANREKKSNLTRTALQAASDMMVNNARKYTESNYTINVWHLAEEDLNALKNGQRLQSPLGLSYVSSPQWLDLEKHLRAFDETWEPWILWLKFRVFGIVSDDVPVNIWPSIEKRLALEDEHFWNRDPVIVNTEFAKLIVETVEVAIEEESKRDQSDYGLRFFVEESGLVSLEQRNSVSLDTFRGLAVGEVIRLCDNLIDLCSSNSAVVLLSHVNTYILTFEGSSWSDDMLLVMRGDALRRYHKSQVNPAYDTDIPPLPQTTLLALEQAVAAHNLLVNSHSNLARIDRMLVGPDAVSSYTSIDDIKRIIHSAERERFLNERAEQALSTALFNINSTDNNGVEVARLRVSAANLIRLVFSHIWNHRKAVFATGSAVAAGVYAVGHWALMNEAIIIGYFNTSPITRLFIKRVFEIIHQMPFLG